jgi:hypothetical protein
MKFYDSFLEDIHDDSFFLLHPELSTLSLSAPFHNLIFYGPPASGKFFFSLFHVFLLFKFKTFKFFDSFFDKSTYKFRFTDFHFEIDFSLLGCNSKNIFFDIFTHIYDMISVTPHKKAFIICKNFHMIHNELLEIFYSYMQQYNDPHSAVQIRFILLTEQMSFIPNNILNICKKISFKRPSNELLQKLVSTKPYKKDVIDFFCGLETPPIKSSNKQTNYSKTASKSPVEDNIEPCSILSTQFSTKELRNIKDLYKFKNKNKDDFIIPIDIFNVVCNGIIKEMIDYENIKIALFRDTIYDVLIYNLDIYECIWHIVQYFIYDPKFSLKETQTIAILKNTFLFFKYYNNNYRPIYHLENIIFCIIKIIHNIEDE